MVDYFGTIIKVGDVVAYGLGVTDHDQQVGVVIELWDDHRMKIRVLRKDQLNRRTKAGKRINPSPVPWTESRFIVVSDEQLDKEYTKFAFEIRKELANE